MGDSRVASTSSLHLRELGVANCNKMGANQSKEDGQGMLKQMKHILSPKKPVHPPPVERESSHDSLCSINSLPPNPKSLSETMASPRLRKEFLTFLQAQDRQAGLLDTECGTAGSLQFVMDVQELVRAGETGDRETQRLVGEQWEQYFPRDGRSGIVLPDASLWRECAQLVEGGEVDTQGRELLNLARDHRVRELATLHPQFVEQRVIQTPMTKLVSCALL